MPDLGTQMRFYRPQVDGDTVGDQRFRSSLPGSSSAPALGLGQEAVKLQAAAMRPANPSINCFIAHTVLGSLQLEPARDLFQGMFDSKTIQDVAAQLAQVLNLRATALTCHGHICVP